MSTETTWLENEAHLNCLTPDLDRVCDRFESAWKAALAGAGPRPHVEDYLTPLPEPERKVLLRELMELDFPYRKRHEEVAGRMSPRPAGSNFATPLPSETVPAQPPPPPEVSPTIARTEQGWADPHLTATEWKEGTAKTATSIRCLHCHQPIDLAPPPVPSPTRGGREGMEEVSCPACGGSFRICDAGEAQRPPRALGKFQLLDRVGVGAYGTVWKARDTELHRVVALKIPHPVLANYPRELERFHREARAAAQLRHPGIVTVHEVAMLEGLPTIVSDFIDGVTLRELSAQRRLTFRQSAGLLAEVADALDYAHSMGLVHRDIKPANIMVRTVVSGGVVSGKEDTATRRPQPTTHHSPLTTHQAMIMDFGLALRDEAEITMTVDGHIVGTPAYMSPEQAAGKAHEADRRSDVYSLGVIFYELLCGELPFRGSKKFILEQVQKQEPRPPRQVNDKIPRDLETICLKAMAKSPSHRYASARELADDLRRFLNGEPILARPVSRAEKLLRWCRRNPGVALTGSAAAACLLALIGLLGLFGIHQSNAAANIAKEQTKTKAAVASLAFDRGRNLCEQGQVSRGLLWLARSLELTSEDALEQQRAIRTNMASWSSQLRTPRLIVHHSPEVLGATLSPDGRTILTGSTNLAQLWDTDTGRQIGTSLPHPDHVIAVAFSPDGKTVMTGGTDKTARLWDARTGEAKGPPFRHGDTVTSVAFSPDGQTIVTGSKDKKARLWDVKTCKLRVAPLPHEGPVTAVAFAPDGKTVLTGAADKTVRLWETDTGSIREPTLMHAEEVNAVAYSADGKSIVTCCEDKRAYLWETATGRLLTSLPGHKGPVKAVTFGPDGKTILTGSYDETARLWDVTTEKPTGQPFPHRSLVHSVAFGPHGKTILTSDGLTTCLWDAASKSPGPRILPHNDQVRSVAFSPDGKKVVTASFDTTARIWDAATGNAIGKPLQHEGWVLTAAFSTDSKTVVTGTNVGTSYLWDAATGKQIRQLSAHNDWIWSVAFSPDAKTVVTSSTPGNPSVWDAATGKERFRLIGHLDGVSSVAYSPDGQFILTGSLDATARLWDASTGKFIRQYVGHQGPIRSIAFSPDGKTVLTGGADRTARLWETATGQAVTPPLSHLATVWTAAFSPDAKMVLTGSYDNTAQLWEAATGQPIGAPLQHKDNVLAVDFNPDGKLFLTGSMDGSVQLWNVKTGQPIGIPFQHQGPVSAAVFSPDGKRILTGSDDSNGRLWMVPGLLEADTKSIVLWTQALTGMELDSNDTVRELNAQEWQQRRRCLEELGLPMP